MKGPPPVFSTQQGEQLRGIRAGRRHLCVLLQQGGRPAAGPGWERRPNIPVRRPAATPQARTPRTSTVIHAAPAPPTPGLHGSTRTRASYYRDWRLKHSRHVKLAAASERRKRHGRAGMGRGARTPGRPTVGYCAGRRRAMSVTRAATLCSTSSRWACLVCC